MAGTSPVTTCSAQRVTIEVNRILPRSLQFDADKETFTVSNKPKIDAVV
jgi:hypothetical protein